MGDFNLNLLKSETSVDVNKFENLFIFEGFFPTISIATHHRSAVYDSINALITYYQD